MIIYNVTVSVEESITSDWLNWMKTIHIPEIMGTGIFTSAQINRVIAEKDSNNTFAISYKCLSMQDLHRYQVAFSDKLREKHINRYGDKVITFRSVMEVIDSF